MAKTTLIERRARGYASVDLEIEPTDGHPILRPYITGRNGSYDIAALTVSGDADSLRITGFSAKRGVEVNGGFHHIPTTAFTKLCAAWLVGQGWQVSQPDGTVFAPDEHNKE